MILIRLRILLLAVILSMFSISSVAAKDTEGTKALRAVKPIVKRVRLKYITASDCLKILLGDAGAVVSHLPAGIVRIDTNDISGTIALIGTPDAIDQTMTFIDLFDVNRKLVELQVTFMRYRNQADKSDTQSTAIAFGKAILPTNGSGDICAVADGHVLRVHLIVHLNGDDSCSVFSQISTQAISEGNDGVSLLGPVKQDAKAYVRGKVNPDKTPAGAAALLDIESLQAPRGVDDGAYFAVITPYRVQN